MSENYMSVSFKAHHVCSAVIYCYFSYFS